MSQNQPAPVINISITSGTIWRTLFILGAVALGYLLFDVVLVLLTAVVIAASIEPATKWLATYKFPRVLAVLTIYLVSFGMIFGFLYVFLPPVIGDVVELSSNLPTKIDSEKILGPVLTPVLSIGGIQNDLVLNDLLSNAEQSLGKFSGGIFSTASSIFGGVFSLLMILVLSFYFAVQEKGIENFLKIVIPYDYEDYAIDLWNRSQYKIGQWMKGQFILALIIGVLVFLGLTIFQVKYAFILSVLAAFFELIPVFGPILAAVPAIIVAFGDSWTVGLMIIGFYIIIQQFENHLIYPLVVKKIVGISPIMVIIALIVGAKLAGFLGVLLAIPLATVLMEVVSDIEKTKLKARQQH
jgi:predicted PurR-regulated permease PerM